MRKKLLRSLVATSLVTALLICSLVSCWLYIFFQRQLSDSMVELADVIDQPLCASADPAYFLSEGIYSRRVTLIDQRGCVLFDNRGNIASLPNHASREEVQEAFKHGEGWSTHLSDTMGEVNIYYARHLKNGLVLRISDTQASIFTAFFPTLLILLIGAVGCVAACTVLARGLTRHIVQPINAIDLNNPLRSNSYEELYPILQRMDDQNQRISEQMRRLEAQRAELDAVLDGMREGLVILDKQGCILVMNPPVRAMLSVQGDHLGRALEDVTSNSAVIDLANEGEGVREIRIQQRIIRVSVSPVADGGMALLFQDITAARRAEESRKQFSANVSHELRTPLTTISGYAEMLASGMANPADAGFLGSQIHQESRRLLTLIEDILRLSRLDEEVPQEAQAVDLHALARHCADKLTLMAGKAHVSIAVEGERVIIPGDQSLLTEMITNLIENSIKYNRPGGSVTVSTGTRAGHAYLSVADTGVGIAPEHQSRVFERFYRVDKSRSKMTGGTGLGLSIVKHGAQMHRATVSLESTPDVGTTITLDF